VPKNDRPYPSVPPFPAAERHAVPPLDSVQAVCRPTGLARQGHYEIAAVALHRNLRERQPGADRPGVATASGPCSTCSVKIGLQEIEGRLPERDPDRHRLSCVKLIEGRQDPSGRRTRSDPGPRGPDRAHRPVLAAPSGPRCTCTTRPLPVFAGSSPQHQDENQGRSPLRTRYGDEYADKILGDAHRLSATRTRRRASWTRAGLRPWRPARRSWRSGSQARAGRPSATPCHGRALHP